LLLIFFLLLQLHYTLISFAKNSTPQRSETPPPIEQKFKTGNYVCETTPCAKLRTNPSIGGFSANG